MRPNVRVDVEETDTNGAYRWQVVVVDAEADGQAGAHRTVYAGTTKAEAVEVSHAVASAIVIVAKWWTLESSDPRAGQ